MNQNRLISIDIPSEYLDLASQWYDGQGDMMYALASTGDLTLGSTRPINSYSDPMSDREWHCHLWRCLSCDVGRAARIASDDQAALRLFEEFCDEVCDRLSREYGIEG